MVEDNVTTLDNQNKNKDPKQAALNKIREAALKESNAEIEKQVKKAVDARLIFMNEKKALIDLLAEQEEKKGEFADLIKEI